MPTTCDIEAGGCAPLVAIDGLPALHVIHTNYTTLGGRVELITGLQQDIGRARDQVILLQEPINTGLRDKVLMLIGDVPSQFPRR